MTERRPFTCPICRRVSHNRYDAENRFCGVCGFVDDVPLHTPGNGLLRIDEVYLFVSVDKDGNEGVCAAPIGGMTVPLIAADKARLDSLIPIARHLSKVSDMEIRLVRLMAREEIMLIKPHDVR